MFKGSIGEIINSNNLYIIKIKPNYSRDIE